MSKDQPQAPSGDDLPEHKPVPWEDTLDPELRDLLAQFEYGHLPEHLKRVSLHFHAVAHVMAHQLPDGAQLRQGLWDLLRSKDCMVRAAVAKARL